MSARLLLAAAVSLASSPLAAAEPADSGPRFGIQLGVEELNWTEEDPNQASRQLLEENGPRLAANLSLDNFTRPAEGVVYALEVRGYYGEVDYDGETQAGVPLRTEVLYTGGLAEGRIGYRFPVIWGGYGLDILAGLGGEYWTRDIQDATDANGTQVAGYEEEYTVSYAKAGLALAELSGRRWYGRLEVGARYPLTIDERIEAFNADLSPGSNISAYAAYEVSKRTDGGNWAGLTIYYESYRFSESPVENTAGGPILQPESDMDVVGLRFGIFL